MEALLIVSVALSVWFIAVKRGSSAIGPCPNCAKMAKTSVRETRENIELKVEVNRLRELCRLNGIDGDLNGFGSRFESYPIRTVPGATYPRDTI